MAIGTPYSAATTVTSTATSASDSITQNADVPQGDTLFIIAATRLASATSLTSVTNDKGIGFTAIVYPLISGVQNGDGWIIQIYASTLLPGVTGPVTWTLNYNQSPTRHCVVAMGVSGVANEVTDAWHYNRDQFGSVQPTVTTKGNVDGGELAIGQVSHVGTGAQNDSGTPSTGFTEFDDTAVGAATPFLHQYVEYQIMPAGAATTVTSAPTFASNTGGILDQIAVFRAAPAPLPMNLLDETFRPNLSIMGPWSPSPNGFFEDRSNITTPAAAPAVDRVPQIIMVNPAFRDSGSW